jgi:hypothetical protein
MFRLLFGRKNERSCDVRFSEELVQSFEGEIAPAFSRRIIPVQAGNRG